MKIDVIKNPNNEIAITIENCNTNSSCPTSIICVPKGKIKYNGKVVCRSVVLVNALGKLIDTCSVDDKDKTLELCKTVISILSGNDDLDSDDICDLIVACRGGATCEECLKESDDLSQYH